MCSISEKKKLFLSVKCATSGILSVSRREQNEVDDFYKSTKINESRQP